jgi:phosphoribosylformimino-5-aminoimidazole carboxamide ribotide isomerase
MELIPAIDLIDGKCVRLSQGDFSRKVIYDGSPLDISQRFEEAGLKRLHLVDLDGAKKGAVCNQRVLEQIASKTSLVIDFGGGVKTQEAIESVFNAGASMASLGSVAVKDKPLFMHWLKQYGKEKILLGADVKGELIAIDGWLETTKITVFDFLAEYTALGVKSVFCTDISKDGLLEGPSYDLYERILTRLPELDFIASGGIASLSDLQKLEGIGCTGAIVGKALYEGQIKLSDLKSYLS